MDKQTLDLIMKHSKELIYVRDQLKPLVDMGIVTKEIHDQIMANLMKTFK